MSVAPSDLLTVLLLVVLEGLLSADNAMVLAVLVLGLPRDQQQAGAALRHHRRLRFPDGGDGAGGPHDPAVAGEAARRGAILLWLPYQHFFLQGDAATRRTAAAGASRGWAFTAFWATVVKVELTDIVFAIDSILVAASRCRRSSGSS